MRMASFLTAAVLAALAPFLDGERPVAPRAAFAGWPTTFEGAPLTPKPLSPRESRFLDGFPGHVARFSSSGREVILRWTDEPTRRLHPSRECLSAVGYTIVPRPAQASDGKVDWQVFDARRGEETLRVRESVVDANGIHWPDVSDWYWNATLGKSRGPWLAITVASRP
ncbi:MAG: hypothetical protein AB2A00_35325 [Myxococcota bacterium]